MFYSLKDTPPSTKPDTSPPANAASGSEYATPDIERVVVNGDTYAVVDKDRKTTKKPKQKVEKIKVEGKRTKAPEQKVNRLTIKMISYGEIRKPVHIR